MTKERTRRLSAPWPFLWSVVPGKRDLVRNIQPKKAKAPMARLKRVPPSSAWKQEALL